MYEQAAKLKKIMSERQGHIVSLSNKKVYCITSGKGGVGKTNLSLNISIALQKMGKKVLLVDADLGLANVDIVSGLYPKYNIYHVLTFQKTINEVLLEGPMGIKILPGASGLYEMANLSTAELDILINSFKNISSDFDIIIIDTGAGISKNVLSFIKSSDEVIVVATPEPSAVTDAYAVIKLTYRYPKKIHVIINRADNFKDAEFTVQKLVSASKKFLGIQLHYLGYVLEDKYVSKSNIEQSPFYVRFPNCLASKCVENLGRNLLYGEQSQSKLGNSTFEGWITKFISFLKSHPGG